MMARYKQGLSQPRWFTKKPSGDRLRCQECKLTIETGEAVYFVPSGVRGHGWYYCYRSACGVNISQMVKEGATVGIRRSKET